MNQSQRLNSLLALLSEHGRLSVAQAQEFLGVSGATVRRDMEHLAKQQLIHRSRGGAMSVSGYDLPLRYKATGNTDAKHRIALAAAAQVMPRRIVGMNGGTTAIEVARAIAAQPDLADQVGRSRVTVVTNAVNIANELTVRPQIKLVMTGGVARTQSYELTGPLARRSLGRLTLDIAFIGAEGVDVLDGITASHEGEAEINGLLVSRARRVVVVADSSKLGKVAFARICGIKAVDELITDLDADPEFVAAVEASGVSVTLT